MKRFKLKEICEIVGVEDKVILSFVEKEWLRPYAPEVNEFDEEDLARTRFILELMQDFTINEAAVPIVLHLVDQLHRLHFELREHTR